MENFNFIARRLTKMDRKVVNILYYRKITIRTKLTHFVSLRSNVEVEVSAVKGKMLCTTIRIHRDERSEALCALR